MENNSKIKAILFDFGGVIKIHDAGDFEGGLLKDIAELIGAPVNDFKIEYFKNNHLSNVKNEPWENMIIKVISSFGAGEEAKRGALSLVKEYQSQARINRDLLALFPALRRQGLKIGILSNATSELRKELEDTGISEAVDEIIISGEIGFQKPHKEAFEAAFKKLNVQPEEVAFVDDASKSLEKHEEIGYTPILFTDNDQLKSDLKDLGIATD